MNASAPFAPAAAAQNLREVRRGVAQAADAQVLQVVRMVDALEVRGATDAVLEPVRARLRTIQPARPLRFARLLFMPLDPLIVPPNAWRPGTNFLPRLALPVLARAVRAHIAAAGDPALLATLGHVDALIATATTAQAGIVRQAGRLVWPQAAAALQALANRPDQCCRTEWAAEGLTAAELQPVSAAVAAILAHAAALHDQDHGGPALGEAALLDILTSAEAAGPHAWVMMLSLLIVRVPASAAVLLAAGQPNRSRALADAAAETALTWLETETADQTAGIGEAAPLELSRQAALLRALSDQPGDAARRRRVADARAHLLAGSLHRLQASLHDHVAAPLGVLPDQRAARNAVLDTVEAAARMLRRFEIEARRLGAGQKFDALVQDVGTSVQGTAGLSRMDRARLVEILQGSDAAARLLA